MQHQQYPRWASTLIALLMAVASTCHAQGTPPENKQDFSDAEKLLFMSNQLSGVKSVSTLRYTFRKTGSFEEGFEDSVVLSFDKQPDGTCCNVKSDFFTGARRLPLPDAPMAEGNPVLLHFLERDIAEMKRLTKGSLNHFRKLIRMAAYQDATVRDASFAYKNKTIAGKEISFSPYLDDPNRPKYEKFVRKTYQFLLSEAVPGGVYGIRTQISGEAAGSPAVIVEELLVDGVSAVFPSQIK
ncbi:MAG: hypothetical protein Q7T97_09190 [Burkholderiaceae bacterium]|nr:hypothetical protein [Burkholderiaceae bacterium]